MGQHVDLDCLIDLPMGVEELGLRGDGVTDLSVTEVLFGVLDLLFAFLEFRFKVEIDIHCHTFKFNY